jgi:hypothetical protein
VQGERHTVGRAFLETTTHDFAHVRDITDGDSTSVYVTRSL